MARIVNALSKQNSKAFCSVEVIYRNRLPEGIMIHPKYLGNLLLDTAVPTMPL
jgi:hypothetical protein